MAALSLVKDSPQSAFGGQLPSRREADEEGACPSCVDDDGSPQRGELVRKGCALTVCMIRLPSLRGAVGVSRLRGVTLWTFISPQTAYGGRLPSRRGAGRDAPSLLLK
ncbi:hypothetical protein DF200_06450 [Bifidobacterium catulorum]|uniref:Uncharacterized protein n=1 Tax=Bifidobacterium catulorum TaxID=1630173 RepID=A0A2U2MS39_9BIFI|nr:hypothetical protein DF200_06450 [Bifidobacterium catulorum]